MNRAHSVGFVSLGIGVLLMADGVLRTFLGTGTVDPVVPGAAITAVAGTVVAYRTRARPS